MDGSRRLGGREDGGGDCSWLMGMFKSAHPRSLRPTVGYRSRFCASVGGIRIGPEDPQRQSARTRADQLEVPPPNVQQRCRGEVTTSMDCVTLPARGGHGSTPKGQTAHSVHILECAV